MVIRVEDLLRKLPEVTYYNYLSYQNEAFAIIEPVSAEQYQRLLTAVRFHQQ